MCLFWLYFDLPVGLVSRLVWVLVGGLIVFVCCLEFDCCLLLGICGGYCGCFLTFVLRLLVYVVCTFWWILAYCVFCGLRM